MSVVLFVLALVALVRILTARPTSRYHSDPYLPRPIAEILAERRTEALIQRCLATRGHYADSLRPMRLAYDFLRDRSLLQWPNGSLEWVSTVRIHAERLQPKDSLLPVTYA